MVLPKAAGLRVVDGQQPGVDLRVLAAWKLLLDPPHQLEDGGLAAFAGITLRPAASPRAPKRWPNACLCAVDTVPSSSRLSVSGYSML